MFAFCSGLGYNIDIPFLDDIEVNSFSMAWLYSQVFFVQGVTSYYFEYDDIVEKEGAAMGNRAFNDELVSRHELEKTELLFDQKTKNLDDKINHLNTDMNNQFVEVNKKLDAIIAEIRELPTKDYVDKRVSEAIIEATKQHIGYTDKKMNITIGVIGVIIAVATWLF